MKRIWLTALVMLLTGGACGLRAGTPAPRPAAPKPADDAGALAAKIDRLLAARWKAARVRPAPRSDDAEFFRRVCLDLTGRIPTLLEARDFLDDDRPDKRRLWVDELLDRNDPDGRTGEMPYARHFATVWRQLFLPQNNTFQGPYYAAALEAWLRERLRKNVGYDQLVRELLTAPVTNDMGGVDPSTFYQANELKPENLAASTSRLFLGHKLECAQCHNHPFARWTRRQFWEYAAFFSGIGQQADAAAGRQIKIAGTDKVVKARFPDGTAPRWKDGASARATLAEWLTRADNPYFARATVNKLWAYFFGTGLIEPVDEPGDDNPPSHPELLDLLAREFAAHHYDLKFLIRALVATRAYQLSSVVTEPGQKDPRRFARMAVRGLSPEQLFDSVAVAIDYQDTNPRPAPYGDPNQNSPRAQFLAKFAQEGKRGEAETSILQALFMMNGDFMARATSLKENQTLAYIANSPLDPAKRIEQLYLIALSRKPTAEESAKLVRYVRGGGKRGDRKQAFADIFWALLNSGEFMLNH